MSCEFDVYVFGVFMILCPLQLEDEFGERTNRLKGKKCQLCVAMESIDEYEKVIFNPMFPLGSHKMALEESLLKSRYFFRSLTES